MIHSDRGRLLSASATQAENSANASINRCNPTAGIGRVGLLSPAAGEAASPLGIPIAPSQSGQTWAGHHPRRLPVNQVSHQRNKMTQCPPAGATTATFQAGHASSILVTRSMA
jgi:hypothetical protein